MCDNSSYLLGADEKGKPDRAKQCFEACAQLHHKLLDGVDDPAAKAILAYFDSWDPAQAAEHPLLNAEWKDLTGNTNLIFGYEAPDHHHILANDAPAIQAAWQAHYGTADADAATMQCLITGKQAPAALVHPAIKGVMGAQSAGAALVSFNAPAFCSYGHEQGENAPVSEYAAFAYTTALNLLIADRNHCKRVGGTTIVCWAESAEPVYQDAFSLFLFGAEEASGIEEADVQAALKRLAAGQTVPFLEKELAPDQHFYVLGLAPNATLLNGVTMRIRAEQDVTRGRAAILKAYYLRNSPTDLNKEVFTVSLNETTNVPYILGRLFSVLEAVQSDANPGINTTIKDRYFNSACATPALVFPTLLKLAQKHLQKLPDGKAVFYNKQITELAALVPESGFPARLSLPDQGKFEIGYYHQTQKRFEKKNKEE